MHYVSTNIIATALRIVARDDIRTEDGVIEQVLQQAAARMERQEQLLELYWLERELRELVYPSQSRRRSPRGKEVRALIRQRWGLDCVRAEIAHMEQEAE